jgi:hypothetical protein
MMESTMIVYCVMIAKGHNQIFKKKLVVTSYASIVLLFLYCRFWQLALAYSFTLF